MKNKPPRRPKKPKLPPSIDGYVLAFYDCLDESAPLEPIDRKFTPSTLLDARHLVDAYNRVACDDRQLTKLLGLFPLGMFR